MIEPIRPTFSVSCSVVHAFEVWTSQIGLWWPSSHTVTAEKNLTIVIEPRRNGRIFERTTSGRDFDWGEVTFWDPPHQFDYLWHLRTDREHGTNVSVRFIDRGDGTTEVRIEQRGFERLGDGTDRRDKNVVRRNVVMPLYLENCRRPA